MPPRAVRSAGGGMGGRYLWTHRVNRRGWGSGGRGFGQLRFLKRQPSLPVVAGRLKTNFGPSSKSNPLFFAAYIILQPPELRAVGKDFEVEAALISTLVGGSTGRKSSDLQGCQ